MSLPDEAYGRLLALRSGLRRFQRWSEQQAREAGLTAAQHQLLLAVRGHPDPRGPTIGEAADYLLLRHHSAIGLVDRAEEAGLVTRTRDQHDQRVIRLGLTPVGAVKLEALSALHLEELKRLAPHLPGTWEDLDPHQPPHGLPAGLRSPALDGTQRATRISIASVYDSGEAKRGDRVLVDRLWPRGIAKRDAPFSQWLKDVAPSTGLRKWYAHDPDRFDEFSRRYRAELAAMPAKEAFAALRTQADKGDVVLLTATRDVDHSAAKVLHQILISTPA
jgi:uncharacterized protein YeaO (DUF488 family)/DNA-binding MarR family transcriptional regulator